MYNSDGEELASRFSGGTIIGLYVNNDGVWKHAEMSGKYVFLEFEDPQGLGTGTHNTLQYKDSSNLLRDLSIDVQSFYDMNLYNARGYIHYEVDDYLAEAETNNDYTTNYRLFVPANWEDQSLPLVIWLHGWSLMHSVCKMYQQKLVLEAVVFALLSKPIRCIGNYCLEWTGFVAQLSHGHITEKMIVSRKLARSLDMESFPYYTNTMIW